MTFDTDYWHTLDQKRKETFGLPADQIGISHGVGDVLKGLKSRIALGISKVELGFMGTGKGSRYSPTGFTPESFSKLEREDIRNLAKVNNVSVTVHASPNAGYLSGWRENQFSTEMQNATLKEIYRALDFAGDTTKGGPVVVHLGEFPRALTSVEPVKQGEKQIFRAYPGEETKAPIRLVKKDTGEIEALPGDLKVFVPKEDEKTGEPIVDPKTGRYQFVERGLDYYKDPKIADKIRDRLKQERGPTDELVFDPKVVDEMKDPGQLLYIDFLRKKLEQAESEEKRGAKEASEYRELKKELTELKSEYEEAKRTSKDPETEKYLLRKILEGMGIGKRKEELFKALGESKKYEDNPEEYLNESIAKINRQMDYYDEAAKSYGRQRSDVIKDMQNKQPIAEYAITKSAEGIATAAMRAYETEKKQGFEKPLFIAPENWTPEIYGSHPQELKEIILKSRKVMEDKLVGQNVDRKQAAKIAADHIKATFDIGHANMWKQYFQGDDKDFKKWLLGQVKELTDSGVLGHVHLTDNFGYGDEHLSPGEGNAPVEEFMAHLKEIGFKGDIIAEPGGQGEGREHEAALAAWRSGRSPIYRIDSAQQSWTDIEGSYLSRMPTPRYMVGEHAANFSKDWSIWSETELH